MWTVFVISGNFFLPGVGSLFMGKVVQGLIQIIVGFMAWTMTFTGMGAVIGLPIALVVWIWAQGTSVSWYKGDKVRLVQ